MYRCTIKRGNYSISPIPSFFCTRSPDGACDTYSFLHCSALTPSLSTILFLLNPTPLSFPPSVPPITPGGATVVIVVPVCRDGGGGAGRRERPSRGDYREHWQWLLQQKAAQLSSHQGEQTVGSRESRCSLS